MQELFLLVLVFVQNSFSINLTYIVKKSDNNFEPSCIAEETTRYSAVGWIYPLPNHEDNLPNITIKFIPTMGNDFNCKFSLNHKCNRIWSIRNWEIEQNHHRQFELILDDRWEDFPTILTRQGQDSKTNKIEIPKPIFRIAISIRANNNIEIFTCEGWNPGNYPCYHINMTRKQLFLHKFNNSNESQDNLFDNYQAYTNIISNDEWRNFIINLNKNGTFSLIDVNMNRTVLEYNDETPLKPLYLFFKSSEPALWKVHQNQFLSTRTAQISRLGPTLSLKSKDLCVSLYISTCPDCEMIFFIIKNGTRKILKEVQPVDNYRWQHIKLKDQNILQDKINIFVETKFSSNNDNKSEGFWAVDSVRICHENEVKVTFLKLKNISIQNNETEIEVADDNEISCQLIEHPRWRPKKLIYPEIKDFPMIKKSVNSTSIKLSWEQEDPNNQINYFITYTANDVCNSEPYNMRRLKSNGFLMTKHNEIKINDLIPFTKYNLTFFGILHENELKLYVTTRELLKPTMDELPNRIKIQVTDRTAYISWDKINCTSIYGHVLYNINVTDKMTQTTITSKIQTDNSIQIDNLQPYTSYTLNIVTGRNLDDFQRNTENTISMKIDFTTKPGEATAIQNLEIYSIDKQSVSIRYDLPKRTNGIPVYIQIVRCSPLLFKKCKTTVLPITRCKLWPKKYCVNIQNLIPYQQHKFQLSIRNDGTNLYGPKTEIEAYTIEQIPGAPSNITYNIVDCKEFLDYCHLNITWLHPYNQNATITAFNIVLNNTDNEISESIREILRIVNETYTPTYRYQIKYIPYSTEYDLYIQSINTKYKSEFVHKRVRTDNIGDHINQKPQLLAKSDRSLVFIVPPVDSRLKSYRLTIIVQDFNKNQTINNEIKQQEQIYDNLCHNYGDTWQLPTIEIKNSTYNVTIGTGNGIDKYLKPSTNYCITFIVTNIYKKSEHYVVYYENVETDKLIQTTEIASSQHYGHLYLLLLLLLLIPVAFLLYRYWKKKKTGPRRRPQQQQQQQQNDNVYESLPFEECDNDNYDHLLQK